MFAFSQPIDWFFLHLKKYSEKKLSIFFLFSSCIEFLIDPHNFRDWLFVRSISIHFLFERGIEGKGEIEIWSLFNNVLIFRKNFLQTNRYTFIHVSQMTWCRALFITMFRFLASYTKVTQIPAWAYDAICLLLR